MYSFAGEHNSMVRQNDKPTLDFSDRLQGVLVGTAVGDALGLPAEGLSRQRIARRWRGEWKHRLLFGRGMISDDTEHMLFVAQALLAHPVDVDGFRRSLAWKLRWWFLSLPAGIGFATLRAVLKLWLGWPAHKSGVFSAGNGPAMRAGIIGAYFYDNPSKRQEYVAASTLLTHTDPKALIGSLAVATMAAWGVAQRNGNEKQIDDLTFGLAVLGDEDNHQWRDLVDRIRTSLRRNDDIDKFAAELGLDKGVSGYVYHTVPVAIYACLKRRGAFGEALRAVLDLGGDTDTVGAIVGAMAGASVGRSGIPQSWVSGIVDWPRTPALLEKVGGRLAQQRDEDHALGAVRYFWPAVIVRNVLFLIVVLLHGFRRLVPV
jgi:ADP-ribosylglycohydrolase